MLKLIIAILRLILFIVGIGLTIAATRYITDGFPGYGSEEHQNRSFWSRWNIKSWYTPRGFKLQITGLCMIAVASTLGLIISW